MQPSFFCFLRRARVLAVAAGLLAGLLTGCKDERPAPPAVAPPATGPSAQYGTPFAGVPDRPDAVIYQVNIRAFSPGGNLAGVTARLDSIQALGANVVYLMPIFPVGTLRGVNSPYAVRDYRAVNPAFGGLADLRALVDGAHARGMSVMLDWVANHTAWDHPWITQHPDWYVRDAAGTIVSPSSNGTTYRDVAQLDFASQPMRAAMIAAMKSWVFAANIDGFRCDYADFEPIDFWAQTTDTLRRIGTHRLLLLAEGTRRANYSVGFDYNFGFGFYGGLKQVYRNGASAATVFGNLNASEYQGATADQHVVRYTTNHDVNSSDGTPVALFGGHDGAMSAFVIAALFKGVPMIYNGQEAGMTTAIPFPFTTVKVDLGARPDVKRAYKQLLAARAGSAALRRGTPTSYSTANVCAFTKQVGAEQVLVLVNVRNQAVTYPVPAALATTTWTNLLLPGGGALTLSTDVVLPAYGYLVLSK